MQDILVHYASEIGLKGKNRRDFENQLIQNIRQSLGSNLKSLKKPYGRIILQVSNRKKAKEKLSKIFGISWYAFMDSCKSDINLIIKAALKHKVTEDNFNVTTKRADKKFPMKSTEVSRVVAAEIAKKYKSNPTFKKVKETIFIEITEKGSFIFAEKIQGLGGLPVGSSGKVLVLMSGGIDSPFAALQIMKRGCHVDYLHFHALRSNSETKKTKISKIIKLLQEYDPNSKLFLQSNINFEIASQKAPSEYHLILFRLYMFKIAEKLADRIKAKAIISGDNLAQVASQTLENICILDRNISMPIFRPLIGYDKQEIINKAKEIGTYEISLEKYKDCCAIVSRKPKTKPKLKKVMQYLEAIELEKIVKEDIASI